MFEDTIKLIRSHDAQLAAFKLKCIREWLPLFENFGRVSYAQGFARQVTIQATLNKAASPVCSTWMRRDACTKAYLDLQTGFRAGATI